MLLDHCYAFSMLLWPSDLKKKFFGEGKPIGPILARFNPDCPTFDRFHIPFVPHAF